MEEKIYVPACHLACENDDLKRKREELKRRLIEGKGGVYVDWLKIFNNFLQKGNFRDDILSGPSSKDVKSKFYLLLFDPKKVALKGIYIPCGMNDSVQYKMVFHDFENYIYTLNIINKTYDTLLLLSYSKNIYESAIVFQNLLIDFFYDTISVEYADLNFSSLQDDWIVKVYSVDIGGHEICHNDYRYHTSEEYIKNIEAVLLIPPNTFIGKNVFIRKVVKLIKMYNSWREKNENILKENLELNFKQLI